MFQFRKDLIIMKKQTFYTLHKDKDGSQDYYLSEVSGHTYRVADTDFGIFKDDNVWIVILMSCGVEVYRGWTQKECIAFIDSKKEFLASKEKTEKLNEITEIYQNLIHEEALRVFGNE